MLLNLDEISLTNRSSKLDAVKAINDVAQAEMMFTPISCRQRKPNEPEFIPDLSPDSIQVGQVVDDSDTQTRPCPPDLYNDSMKK